MNLAIFHSFVLSSSHRPYPTLGVEDIMVGKTGKFRFRFSGAEIVNSK